MAKFSKYNQPRKTRKPRKAKHSQEYINERKNEMFRALNSCKNDVERQIIIDAFNLSI